MAWRKRHSIMECREFRQNRSLIKRSLWFFQRVPPPRGICCDMPTGISTNNLQHNGDFGPIIPWRQPRRSQRHFLESKTLHQFVQHAFCFCLLWLYYLHFLLPLHCAHIRIGFSLHCTYLPAYNSIRVKGFRRWFLLSLSVMKHTYTHTWISA